MIDIDKQAHETTVHFMREFAGQLLAQLAAADQVLANLRAGAANLVATAAEIEQFAKRARPKTRAKKAR